MHERRMRMAKGSEALAVTPGQATWIVERLIATKRISADDVRAVMGEMQTEIAEIEQRLARLREAAGNSRLASPAAPSASPPSRSRKRRAGGKKGHPRGIAGTLAVLLRSIPAAEHAAIAAIRVDKGIKTAIAAAKAAVRRG
jgi:hypothetical protein